MRPESRVLWAGRVPLAQVRVSAGTESTRAIEPAVEALIEAEWARQLADASAAGQTYYDAPAYRLNDFVANEAGIELRLGQVPYRVHAAMKRLHTDSRIAEEHTDRTLIVDSVLRTADRQFVLHQVEKVVETETYLIGGSCSVSRMTIGRSEDLVAYALDRVDAITGLRPGERELAAFIGLVQNEIGCVHAIFAVETLLTAADMRTRFVPGATSKALEIIPAAAMPGWIATARGYMAVMAPVQRQFDPISHAE